MNKLLQLKDRNSLDAFNSLVSDLQEANEEWHRMDRSDERSSGRNDYKTNIMAGCI